jgi:benzodiazapine receptor
MNNFLAYLISFLVVCSTSFAGQFFTSQSVKSEWAECVSPSIAPPKIVFPVVWTTLYFFIFLAFGRSIIIQNTVLIQLFVFNLLLNVLWCYLYFRLKEPSLAFPTIIIIITTALYIAKISYDLNEKTISYLMIPYISWLCFASVLNILSISNLKKCNNKKIKKN